MIVITCLDHRETKLYNLAEASRMVCVNRNDVPVDGIHSESLRRRWRETGKGERIGRDVYFTPAHLNDMGYKISEDKLHTTDKISVTLEGN